MGRNYNNSTENSVTSFAILEAVKNSGEATRGEIKLIIIRGKNRAARRDGEDRKGSATNRKIDLTEI